MSSDNPALRETTHEWTPIKNSVEGYCSCNHSKYPNRAMWSFHTGQDPDKTYNEFLNGSPETQCPHGYVHGDCEKCTHVAALQETRPAQPSNVTKECPRCEGSGAKQGESCCIGCGGRGYVLVPETIPEAQPPSHEAEQLARRFHETYERLAPEYGYKTRPASATAWEKVPEQNKCLMIATCAEILTAQREASVAPPCADCEECARHAYSDATTPGFFYSKCEKHRAQASVAEQPSPQDVDARIEELENLKKAHDLGYTPAMGDFGAFHEYAEIGSNFTENFIEKRLAELRALKSGAGRSEGEV